MRARFNAVRKAGLAKLLPSRPRIAVGMGTCGTGNGAEGVYHAFADAIDQRGLDVQLAQTGCFGFCAEEPLVNVWIPGQPLRHAAPRADRPRRPDPRRTDRTERPREPRAVQDRAVGPHHRADRLRPRTTPTVPAWDEVPFFKGQKKIVLRNCGLINPDDIEEYIAIGGYQSLYKVLIDGTPETVIEQIKAAKLRGRGGAGFSTGLKWEYPAQGRRRPEVHHLQRRRGRSRRLHEPQRDRERSALAARRHGRSAATSRAPRRASSTCAPNIRWRCIGSIVAIEQAREYGVLGDEHPGARLRLRHRTGRRRRRVRLRRRDRADQLRWKGSRDARGRVRLSRRRRACGAIRPTSTTSRPGTTSRPSSPKARRGSPRSAATQEPGTKVFSLVGKVKNTGLVEMPLGTPLSKFVYDVGGGSTHGHNVKAVQTGGPSGGCIPHEMFDTPVDYETLAQARLHHGLGRHGGDGRRQLHGRRRPLLHRVHPLGILRQMHAVPRGAGQGAAHPERASPKARAARRTWTELDELGRMIRDTSLCGLGQTAPNSGADRACGTSATSSRTTSARSAAAPAFARIWRSRRARTVARCT